MPGWLPDGLAEFGRRHPGKVSSVRPPGAFCRVVGSPVLSFAAILSKAVDTGRYGQNSPSARLPSRSAQGGLGGSRGEVGWQGGS